MKNTPPDPKSILSQIAAIPAMEMGKLCPYVPSGRAASTQPYFKLQSWQGGKNVTRHVRSEHLPQLQAALEGYARFRQLCDQYAQVMVERTHQEWSQDIKKKQILHYARRSPRNSQ
jgi:hypothetical protein